MYSIYYEVFFNNCCTTLIGGNIMNALRSLVYLSLLLLLGACATGPDTAIHEKHTGKVVSIAELDTATRYGYIIGPDGLDTLADLGVVCEDDEAVLQKTYEKLGSYVYCENSVMAKQHVMMIKLDMVPIANSSEVMVKHFKAWVTQAKLSFGSSDNLNCVDRSKRDRPSLPLWKDSFTDCTFTYHGKQYFIGVVSFGAKEFRNSTQLLILGDIQDPSDETKAKTRLLTEEIAQSFVATRKSAKRLK